MVLLGAIIIKKETACVTLFIIVVAPGVITMETKIRYFLEQGLRELLVLEEGDAEGRMGQLRCGGGGWGGGVIAIRDSESIAAIQL